MGVPYLERFIFLKSLFRQAYLPIKLMHNIHIYPAAPLLARQAYCFPSTFWFGFLDLLVTVTGQLLRLAGECSSCAVFVSQEVLWSFHNRLPDSTMQAASSCSTQKTLTRSFVCLPENIFLKREWLNVGTQVNRPLFMSRYQVLFFRSYIQICICKSFSAFVFCMRQV